MAEKRKDSKGRNLKDNESVMPDGRYRYRYTDKNGNRKAVYSWKLVPTDKVPTGKRDCVSLRQMEKEIEKDIQDGIDSSVASNITLNEMFDKYIGMKTHLKDSTRNNYLYCYDHFVRDTIGNRKIKTFRYSDIKSFYNGLIQNGMKPATVDIVHTVLHPTFTLAVRDGIIRSNPSDGVVAELKKNSETKQEQRHALTVDEQEAFIDFIKNNETFQHWLPLMTFFLGTGCRVGEVIGLTWNDIDFKNNTISINHNTTYRPDSNRKMVYQITTPKTESGKRTIPMFNEVRESLFQLKREQFATGLRCNQEIDGYSNFVFLNRYGLIFLPQTINRGIKRIVDAYNKAEAEQAKKENRTPFEIRLFSAHNLRHTFCTRLCEVENNLKLIMAIMGHTDVQTTMNIYNEIQEKKKKSAFEELEGKLKIS